MTDIPRQGSVNGECGLPAMSLDERKAIRVTVNGDMPRSVVAFDADAGWVDVIQWDDDGRPLHNGEDFVTQRLHGTVEVRSA